MPVRGGIFTSYRRADSATLAGRIADFLSYRYPDSQRDKIRAVVHDGRVEKGTPPFPGLTIPHQVNDVIAFIRDQTKQLNFKPGGHRGVDVADLQTGNIEQGKAYFNGPGEYSSCHSSTGDLAGIATRRKGLELEMPMLYLRNAKAKLTVITKSGETLTGTLTHKDEFHIAMTDFERWSRSRPIRAANTKSTHPRALILSNSKNTPTTISII